MKDKSLKQERRELGAHNKTEYPSEYFQEEENHNESAGKKLFHECRLRLFAFRLHLRR